jgi:hypothetical protein
MNRISLPVRRIPISSGVGGLAAADVVSLKFGGCGTNTTQREVIAIIAKEGDVGSFHPLFAEEVVSGEIDDLISPHLSE